MRLLVIIVVLAVVAIAAGTIADYPGSVDIIWQGLEINTSVGALIAATVVLALVLWALFALAASVVRLPGRFRRNRRERRRRAGEIAVVRGFGALAVGDGVAALRYAGRAEALLERSPLTWLLAAQAAQLAGDDVAARRHYLALRDGNDSELLGLRGLLGEAVKSGDGEEARRLARRTYELRPTASGAFETLFLLEIAAGHWDAARDVLDGAARRHLLPADRAAHHRGVILYELSLAAEAAGEQRRALSLAASAVEAAPDLAAAAVRHARLLIADDRQRAGRRAVEQAWYRAPHPELARVWGELGSALPALEVVTWFERLAAQNPDSPESHIAVAEAALAAQLWGEARRRLGLAAGASASETPSRRLCLLMARLEESEHPQSGEARRWLDRAIAAQADPGYVCTNCGTNNQTWQALCGHCRAFDTLRWQAAAPVSPRLPAFPPAEPLAASLPLLAVPNRLASTAQPGR
jgi:HemY protein